MHQADFMSNLPQDNDMVEVRVDDPESDDEGDGTELMQRYLHTGGRDTNEDRWQRCITRLQKELSSQSPAGRWANIKRIRQALPACEPWSAAESRREQLRALLVAMLDAVPEGAPTAAADESWLGSWGNELEFFLPGTLFPLAVVPVPVVDSDSASTMAGTECGNGCHRPMNPSPPLSPLPREDLEPDEVEMTKRKLETTAYAEKEAELLQSQAAAYQAWERQELDLELSRRAKKRPLESCRLTVEASSGSGDKPRHVHSYCMMVPASVEELRVTITATMVQDPGEEVVTDDDKPLDKGYAGQEVAESTEGSVPGGGLAGMTFADYEQVYRQWKSGALDLQQIQQNYGNEVAELLVTHDLVAEQTGDTVEEVIQAGIPGSLPAGPSSSLGPLPMVTFGELVATQLEHDAIDLCTEPSGDQTEPGAAAAGQEGEWSGTRPTEGH